MSNVRPGAVIFAADLKLLADFYKAMTGLSSTVADDSVVVLRCDTFELVIHKLAGEPEVSKPPIPRYDHHIKPFFPVSSLDAARETAARFGGKLQPKEKEWSARGFRACEAIDPEGNVIQFREDIT